MPGDDVSIRFVQLSGEPLSEVHQPWGMSLLQARDILVALNPTLGYGSVNILLPNSNAKVATEEELLKFVVKQDMDVQVLF